MLTVEKIATDRGNARNLGAEAAIRKLAATEEEREDLRAIYQEASAAAAALHTKMAGDERFANQVKTAFMNHGIPVLENAMSDNEKKEFSEELRKAASEGLTPKKILTDRQNAFETGTEVFMEKVGMDEETAESFRGIISEGLAELSQDPEVVQQALAAE